MKQSFKSKENILKIYGRDPVNLNDLAKCVIKVINYQIMKSTNRNRVVGFAWNVRYTNVVSNTHYCPLNGTTNWYRYHNLPTEYQGWVGRVWIRYQQRPNIFGNSPFNMTLTYPGTGGLGGYNGPWENVFLKYHILKNQHKLKKVCGEYYPEPQIYSWDYKFFEADWPNIYKNKIFDLLAEKSPAQHTFCWENRITKNLDKELLNQ